MKKLFPAVSAVLLAAALIALLAACGGSKIKNDVPVSEIAAAVDTAIGNDGSMVAVDAVYVKNMLLLEEAAYSEFALKVNAGNLDEYGIFKGRDAAQANALAKSVEEYLKKRNEAWTFQYMPEEYPKLRDAEFKTVGNYVIYTILTEDAKADAFKTLQSKLGS